MSEWEGLRQAQIEWAHDYNGYERLASSPESLLELIVAARRQVQAGRGVPEWCGVDFLRGWAFYMVREDRHGGGYSLEDPQSVLFREWSEVLAALAGHPAAGPGDRPPLPMNASGTVFPLSTAPRAHKDPAFLEAKRARLWEPHVAPINAFVNDIKRAGKGDVPYQDPDSGGVNARVLLLLEAPARAAAHESGMLSADNDDGTAANVWQMYADTGMPRSWGIHWNAVPWYVGTQEKIKSVTAGDVAEGRRWLAELLELLPDLRVVLAMGVAARNAAEPIQPLLDERDIKLMGTWHPSNRNFNTRPESRPQVLEEFTKAYALAGGPV